MLSAFEKIIADYIAGLSPFNEAERVLLAVSGGADSTALLYTSHALKDEGILRADLICAHINHQLRIPDGDIDEEFVIAQAEKLSLPIVTRKIDVRGFARENKLSIETAARTLRLRHLQEIAEANGCKWIATAHQKNDNAETVLHRLLRGTGFRGLAGIWPLRNFAGKINFVRPLLCVTREQIIDYLQNRNLKWRTDRTNYDCRYKRNFIRHKLIPQLQKNCAGSMVETLYELSASAQRFQGKVENLASQLWTQIAETRENKVALDLHSFLNQPEPVQVELVCYSLAHIGCGQGDLTQRHFEKIFETAKQNIGGRKITLPGGFRVWREYENLIFAPTQKEAPPGASGEIILKVPGLTKFGNYSIEATVLDKAEKSIEEFKKTKTPFVEWFDFDKLQPPLLVRSRRIGDKFVPLGLKSQKKVGKFLTLAKVPSRVRRELLIVADARKIIWLCPVRITELAKLTAQTSKILQLQISGSRFLRLVRPSSPQVVRPCSP
jgi:tRNA(Ile)-lysidine synthase